MKNASYTNDIGDSQLSVVWEDPDFDASQRAVYYVRVIGAARVRRLARNPTIRDCGEVAEWLKATVLKTFRHMYQRPLTEISCAHTPAEGIITDATA